MADSAPVVMSKSTSVNPIADCLVFGLDMAVSVMITTLVSVAGESGMKRTHYWRFVFLLCDLMRDNA